MRNPGFPVVFETGTADVIQITLATAERHPAKDLLADGVMGRALSDLGLVLADAAAAADAPKVRISAKSRHEIEVILPGAVFSEDWHLAAIFNLIEQAIFLGQEEDPFIIAGVLRAARFADASMERLQQSLGTAVQAARSALNSRLTSIGAGDGSLWPEHPIDWLIDMQLDLSHDLRPEARAEVAARFELLNALLGETAFDPEADPLVWLEEALAPYPAAAEVRSTDMTLAIEMPPSDPALILILFERTLEFRYRVTVTRWMVELREGW